MYPIRAWALTKKPGTSFLLCRTFLQDPPWNRKRMFLLIGPCPALVPDKLAWYTE